MTRIINSEKKEAAEKTAVEQIKKDLAGLPEARFIRNVGNMFQEHGLPDFVGCFRRLFIAIEVKNETSSLTENQKRVKKEIEAAGGIYFIVRPSTWPQIFKGYFKSAPRMTE